METVMNLVNTVKDNWVQISLVITSIIGAASVIVKITPTPKDDNFLAKVKEVVSKFIALN